MVTATMEVTHGQWDRQSGDEDVGRGEYKKEE